MRTIIRTDELIMNTITAVEVAHYLSRRLTGSELKRRMNALTRLTEATLTSFDNAPLGDTINQLADYAQLGLGGRDATILATMTAYDADHIVTQEKDLKRIAADLGFGVIDPLTG